MELAIVCQGFRECSVMTVKTMLAMEVANASMEPALACQDIRELPARTMITYHFPRTHAKMSLVIILEHVSMEPACVLWDIRESFVRTTTHVWWMSPARTTGLATHLVAPALV